ncbi:HemY domain protein [gamma proteobacterium HTCC5015]|nr:HemY domain protein [gamma proteobacterium HTCC5015]
MKALLLIVLCLALGIALAWTLANLDGYFLISLGGWQIENDNLIVLLILALLLFSVFWLALRIARTAWKLPDNFAAYSEKRRQAAAHKSLSQGLIDLIECRWASAEKQLLAHIDYSETPLLNYLGASRAAAQQNAFERRDQYLKAAHESDGKADVAILLTQADLQLSHQQTEQALATLSRLRQIAPRHGYVLKLLSRLHHQLREWDKLARILPELKKSDVLTPEQLESLQLDTYKGMLEDAAKNRVDQSLGDAWSSLPKVLRKDNRLVAVYANALVSQGDHQQAEKLIRSTLVKHWDENLVRLYGQLDVPNNSKLLEHCDAWLSQQPNSPALLLALARINRREELWGRSEEYYRKAMHLAPDAEICAELGDMLDKLGRSSEAAELYRQGLKQRLPR